MSRLSKVATRKKGPYVPSSNNYHLALADYIHNLLSEHGIKATKHRNATVRVKSPHTADYLILDCLDGKIYLKSNDKVKHIGRLRAFGRGQHLSDAYQCAYSSLKAITRCMEGYLTGEELKTMDKRTGLELTAVCKDQRQFNQVSVLVELPVKDLRKTASNIICKDLRRERRSFVTVVKGFFKNLKKSLSDLF